MHPQWTADHKAGYEAGILFARINFGRLDECQAYAAESLKRDGEYGLGLSLGIGDTLQAIYTRNHWSWSRDHWRAALTH